MGQLTNKLSRRFLFAGAGTLGAAAAVATWIPSLSTADLAAQALPKVMPEKGGGYALSAHVKRYYKTTLL
ncbi:MAG: hypothetical protein ACI9I0_002011 [Rhodoferax sp.]|jgi:hypothetical protein